MNDGCANPLMIVGAWFVGIVLFLLLITGLWAGWSSFSRYQSRQNRNQNRQQSLFDANNQVRVNNIRIRYFEQEKGIAKQKAQIRYLDSVGVRRAQDEIAKTLTPLYVQFEMVQAIQAIAQSGRNNSVIYIPAGQGGVPVITAQGGTGK